MSLIDLDLPDLILITLEFFFRNLNFEVNLFHLRIAQPFRKIKILSISGYFWSSKFLFKTVQVHIKGVQSISW